MPVAEEAIRPGFHLIVASISSSQGIPSAVFAVGRYSAMRAAVTTTANKVELTWG
jgi:hypothetical protein